MYILALIRKYWKCPFQTYFPKTPSHVQTQTKKEKKESLKANYFYTEVPHIACGLYPLPKDQKKFLIEKSNF